MRKDNIEVRHVFDEDTIRELHEEILKGDEFYEHKHNIYWLAYCNGYLAGFCIATKISPSIVFLSRAGVLPEYRGKGIQKRMIQVRLWWARKIGAKHAVTYTSYDNLPSSNNLIKTGFVLFNPEWPWVGTDYNYWIREIE